MLYIYYLLTATFDVQGESITCDQGLLKITCIFARGSLAQGCLIVIVPVGNESSVYSEKALRQNVNNVLSQNASHFFNLSLGTYNILILDVEADGSVDTMRRLYSEIRSVNPSCVLPSPTASLPATSSLVQGFYLALIVYEWDKISLVLRPFPPPVFDSLQYANMEGGGLGDWSCAVM